MAILVEPEPSRAGKNLFDLADFAQELLRRNSSYVSQWRKVDNHPREAEGGVPKQWGLYFPGFS
ncbi:transcriptional regulator domain-containing protein [Sphingomonas sp. 8AM]|uniref:transcriptional regulator domain-containing protein n=1 Tax=Sphingomonas sp. 8AM TaxID=2653170 RepID=UPI0012F0B696|nr:conserved hypothetical protein [Sphingomonas sp. 8AM]